MNMRPLSFVLVSLLTVLFMRSASPQGGEFPKVSLQGDPLLVRRVGPLDIVGVPLVDALLEIAQREHIPMGIEYIDEQALTATVSVHAKETTLAGVLSLVLPRSSGYVWSERYGVIDITHVGAPIGRANLLDHVIPTFDIPRSSLDEFSFELEMALKHDLNPEAGGFGGDYISMGPAVFVGPFHLREASVREILSRVAGQEGPAAWVVTVPPEGFSQASSHSLWKMLPYTQPATRYSSLLLQALGQVGYSQDREVGYLDLTTAVVGQRIHEPTTGSGSGMGIGSSVRTRPKILQPLRISIVSLGSTKYKVDDDVVYEIKVENTGHEQLMIPWDPNLSHMEPEGAATEYSYRIASIALRLSHAGKPFETLASNLLFLFGTTGVPSSFIKIAPGEWVRVRAKARLSPAQSPQPDAIQGSERSVSARVVWTISNAHVSRRADGYHEDVTTEGPENISVNTESFELDTQSN